MPRSWPQADPVPGPNLPTPMPAPAPFAPLRQVRKSVSGKGDPQHQILVLDLSKAGRIDTDKLEAYMTKVALVKGGPELHSVTALLVVAPLLSSDKVANGLEGERRRIYDKLVAKDWAPNLVTVRASKKTLGEAEQVQLLLPCVVVLPR